MLYNFVKIADEILMKTVANKLADYLQTKIPSFQREIGRKTLEGWEIIFKKKYQPNTYSITVEPDLSIIINFYEQVEISSESLADPKKTYETTTGRIVKLKRKKLRKHFDDEDKALKAINNFFK